MRAPVFAAAVGLALLAAVTARASDWDGEIGFDVEYHENFLQAPEGSPKTNITASTLRLRLSRTLLGAGGTLQPYLLAAGTFYQEYDQSPRVAGGLILDRRPLILEATGGYYWQRPGFEIGDEFDVSNGLQLGSRLSYRVSQAFQLESDVAFRHESYDRTETKNSRWVAFAGGVRYRGFGYLFSPGLRVAWGSRDTVDDNDDYSQRDIELKLSSLPSPSVYLSARYRFRARAYRITDAEASNFAREDNRYVFSAAAAIGVTADLTLNLYYVYQDADSTKESRIFAQHLFSAGLTAAF